MVINAKVTVISPKAVSAVVKENVEVTVKKDKIDEGNKIIGTKDGEEINLEPKEPVVEPTITSIKKVTVEEGAELPANVTAVMSDNKEVEKVATWADTVKTDTVGTSTVKVTVDEKEYDVNLEVTAKTPETVKVDKVTIININKKEDENIVKALSEVNTVTDANKMMEAIEKNAEILGLDTGEGTDYDSLIVGRDRSVSVDLYNNRPNEGYTLEQLNEIFDDIVKTRLVTQESINMANDAQSPEELEGYVTILLNRFEQIDNPIYTKHSSHKIVDKIGYLQGLVDRYEALDDTQKTDVLQKVLDLRESEYSGRFARSQYITDAFESALEYVEKPQTCNATVTATARKAGDGATDKGEIGVHIDFNTIKVSELTELEVTLYNEASLLVTNVLAIGKTKTDDSPRVTEAVKALTYIDCSFNFGCTGNSLYAWDRGVYTVEDEVAEKDIPTKVVVKYVTNGITYEAESDTLNFKASNFAKTDN